MWWRQWNSFDFEPTKTVWKLNIKDLSKLTNVRNTHNGDYEVQVEFCPDCQTDILTDGRESVEEEYSSEINDRDEQIAKLENRIAELEELIEQGVHVEKSDIDDVIKIKDLWTVKVFYKVCKLIMDGVLIWRTPSTILYSIPLIGYPTLVKGGRFLSGCWENIPGPVSVVP